MCFLSLSPVCLALSCFLVLGGISAFIPSLGPRGCLGSPHLFVFASLSVFLVGPVDVGYSFVLGRVSGFSAPLVVGRNSPCLFQTDGLHIGSPQLGVLLRFQLCPHL